MVPNRSIYYLTVVVHVVLVLVALSKVVLQENLRSQLLEQYDGMLVSGGATATKQLWLLGLRLLQLVDVQAVLLHGSSILLSNRFFHDPYSRHLNGMSHLWSVLTCCCMLTNLLAMLLFFRFISITYSTVQDSLYGGLEMYQFDSVWSDFWNNLQTHSQCCGVRNHTDWTGMLWETPEKEDQFRRLLLPDGGQTPAIVPISCCRKQHHHCTGAQRINLGVTELLRTAALDGTSIINHTGCFASVQNSLASTVRLISTLDVILCSMQFGTIFLMRILFIANRNFQSNSAI
ncbi:uncharacterized protein LOC120904095 [Anopheles arabiensis]|uniref:Tetraspanin n=1 Tax=Anopheles arabiensis TaxID=7173 RepID=A0A8W7MTY9_ANOAR|nr:uncharacterized protein LOC120904095 [Anopheles arabiensis]